MLRPYYIIETSYETFLLSAEDEEVVLYDVFILVNEGNISELYDPNDTEQKPKRKKVIWKYTKYPKDTISHIYNPIRATWSPEAIRDIEAMHGIDVTTELEHILSQEISAQIDAEILNHLEIYQKRLAY